MSSGALPSSLALSAQERAPIYAWLARLLVREVDAETLTALRDPVVSGFFEAGTPGFTQWAALPPTRERLDTLAEEFARLFLVPGGVPLFASAWLDGDQKQLAGDLADFVDTALSALGRKTNPTEPWGRLPLDHLALWLDLIVAAASEKPEVAEHLVQQWMGPWVGDLGRALNQQASSPLYKGIGALLAALHSQESE